MKRIVLLAGILILSTYSLFAQLVDPVKWEHTSQKIEDGIAEIEFDDGKVMKFMLKYTPIHVERD